MYERLIISAAALAILSGGSLLAPAAKAGGAQAKTGVITTAFAAPVRKHKVHHSAPQITEFSSSSATQSKSKPNR